ncbi:troponin I, cardiac muscle-like [Scleropages formosus]|uniref:Troponin I, cardiac muscle-like n=2 Tax=Scleropages formosus TaxID=113540 RepID=A0A0P7Z9Z2_SCLFO|nr:troponin I, cardiac muscle-like [Scleropages formosus]
MSSSRKHNLKSLMLSIAKGLLEAEKTEAEAERKRYMEENCPALSLPGSVQDLQELCKKLHQQIDKVDEERYDLQAKAEKADKEIEDLKIKVIDLKGKFKKPALRKSLEAVGDWRKNIEDKAGMDGRKKIHKKMSSSRKHNLKSLMLSVAKKLLETEKSQYEANKAKHLADNCPPLSLPSSLQELQEVCKKLHQQIDKVDEERYDLESKVSKGVKEIEDLKIKPLEAVGDWRKNIEDKAGMDGRKKMKKMTSSRRHHLKSLMLQVAKGLLEAKAAEAKVEKKKYMEENCPALSVPGSVQELQELCRKLHQRIDKVDEERYDLQLKAEKAAKEIEDLKIKVIDLKGKFKKPALRKVRMSADAMLQALLGSRHKVSLDLRANLKQVKKEAKEEQLEAVGDWRKSIEDKAGMDGRKKMFESEA